MTRIQNWTTCKAPSWSISSDDGLLQVRAMLDVSSPVEVILDSGADVRIAKELFQCWYRGWAA